MKTCRSIGWAVALGLSVTATASAQTPDNQLSSASPFLGSVSKAVVSLTRIELSAKDAVQRALEFNLGLLLQEEAVKNAHGALARAGRPPAGHLGKLHYKPPGHQPRRVAFRPTVDHWPVQRPDARVKTPRPFSISRREQSARHRPTGARRRSACGRGDLVTLVAINLYLEAVAGSTASKPPAHNRTPLTLCPANQRHEAGWSHRGRRRASRAGATQNQRQRTIRVENQFEKSKLQLARAIGLPVGQPFTLTDRIPYAPLADVTLEGALKTAYESRADFLAARERLAAAEASRRAAESDHIPTLHLDADYGVLGQTLADAHATFRVAANVRVPIFDAGKSTAKRIETDAELKRRQAELEHPRPCRVRRPDRDARSARRGLAARSRPDKRDARGSGLEQARDRFAAGVAGNIEVTQAQQSVAIATESYIDALYSHNLRQGHARTRRGNSGTIGDGVFGVRSKWIEGGSRGRSASRSQRWRTARWPRPVDRAHRGCRCRRRPDLCLAHGRTSVVHDDAQIDGHITQVAARVGGTVAKVNVVENQYVQAGTVLVELDPRDYQVAVERARAELADAQANAAGAVTGIPLTQVSSETGVRTATGGVEEAQAGVGIADRQVEAARAQLVAAQARQREKEATAVKAARDVERFKGLVAKEEIAQQQYDAAVSASESARASADAARSDVHAADAAVAVAEQRARQSRGAAAQAQAALEGSRTGPEQLQVEGPRGRGHRARQAVQGRAGAGRARPGTHVDEGSTAGVVSGVRGGRSDRPGGTAAFRARLQEGVWVTANFKETQLRRMQPGSG